MRAPYFEIRPLVCSLERTVSRAVHINPAGRARRNDLDRDSGRLDGSFVADDVHVGAAGIDKPHARRIHIGLASRIVAFIVQSTCPP